MTETRIRLGTAFALAALAVSLVAFAGTPGARAGSTGTDGDISLNSFVSSSNCTSTNCATSSTGFTNKGSGLGLYARADAGDGLYGFSLAGGAGVVGSSNTQSGVEGHGSNGVYGEGTENGVQAQGGTFGVFAEGTDYGVFSRAPNHGVFGQATSSGGAGIDAAGSNGALALRVTGKAKFSRSGITTIAAGASSKTITLAGVTTASMVLATSQQNATVFVRSAVPASGSFTIRLSGAAPTGGLKVAYFVLN
jgi:hypothetical protein